ncbi:MAG TPA: NAD-dependent epimerase/dehydratase family protein [Pararhizobium sp.]|uniref:NAD-dependent epimerase/dehydratase family protein n=1 Tax=Pararhizobium sp. TaxID=1977563 RepID=UPI002B9DD3B4|nr:NAD-dependent epimerase/dehydratase family protein [Pararhizobium sp.]HTO31250.1 NAD-dependent epimerase/dehydratase family protein [Pararhizobium sp.]
MSVETKGLVLVTGIGGFLGRHVAAELLAAGYEVRGTLRSMKRAKIIAAAIRSADGATNGKLTFATADLLSDTGWTAAFSGVTDVIHTASPFPSKVPKDENDLIAPAREGTLRVLRSARDAGVRHVVLTSSTAAVSYGSGTAPFTEADWTDVNSPLATAYYKSKTLAEQAAWSFARESGLPLTVINPGMILGPLLGGENGTSVGLVRALLIGKYPALPDFRVPVVDVRDVADAHVRALEVPEAIGERFIIAGETLSVKDIAAALRRDFPAYAGKIPRFVLPNWLAGIASRFDPGLNLIVAELGRDARVSNEKARRVLGWRPRPEADAIRASADSLIAAGLV